MMNSSGATIDVMIGKVMSWALFNTISRTQFPNLNSTAVSLVGTQFLKNGRGFQVGSQHWSGNLWRSLSEEKQKDDNKERITERNNRLKLVYGIMEVLLKEPGRTMTLSLLGKHRRKTGVTPGRRGVALLNRFPAVFRVNHESSDTTWVSLTEAAEHLYDKQMKLKSDSAVFMVEKLRKLLMMTHCRKLAVSKIAQLKNGLGLPEDWKTSILPKYPQYFQVVETDEGPELELAVWDPLLAVPFALEKGAAQQLFDDGDEGPAPFKIVINGKEIKTSAIGMKGLNLPQGYKLSRKSMARASKVQRVPYQSPYEINDVDADSVEADKRACATVHELLNLTLEKKLLVDQLVHLKEDFNLVGRIHVMRAILIRHPKIFGFSIEGNRDWVFLQEAYTGSELIEKDPIVLAKERFNKLVVLKDCKIKSKIDEENYERRRRIEEEDQSAEEIDPTTKT